MKFPMFKVHIDKKAAMREIEKTLSSGYLNEGEQVNRFRSFIQQYLDEKFVTMTNSCTSALTLALILSGVGKDDEVVTTAMTCLATNTPILNLGGKIVWADIDKETGCITSQNILKKITVKTKAVICVNWAGIPCDMEEISKICKERNIKLIQDAAHSIGSKINNKSVSKYADFTCYSFQAIKHITTGDGGAIVCRSKVDYERCNKLKWFGLDREQTKDEKGEWKGQRWETDVKEAGYKFHMNNIAASIGLSQIKHVDRIIHSHKANAKLYKTFFKDIKEIKVLKTKENFDPSYWVFTFLLSEEFNRDEILKTLNDKGVNAGLVHIPNHNYTCFKESYCDLPETDYFSNHQISLPCGWWLDKDDITEIVKVTLESINDNKKRELL